MDTITEIMEYIKKYGHTEKTSPTNLIKKFGKENYEDFVSYVKTNKLAVYPISTQWFLNDAGNVELHNLKKEKSRDRQQWLMIAATFVVAGSAFLQAFAIIYGSENAVQAIEAWQFSIGQIILFVIILYVVTQIPKILKLVMKYSRNGKPKNKPKPSP